MKKYMVLCMGLVFTTVSLNQAPEIACLGLIGIGLVIVVLGGNET